MASNISGNAGVAGATVQYLGTTFVAGTNIGRGFVTADGSGNYSITGLANGTYNINPYKPGYYFTPGGVAQAVSGANITGLNFTATLIGNSGIWVKQGTVIVPTTADLNGGSGTSGTQEPTVLYEANPVLISANGDGKVFKMWFAGGVNIYYAESNDGLAWIRQAAALAVTTNQGNPTLWHQGSTYYLYVAEQPGIAFPTQVDCWTSTDGVTFTLAKSAALSIGAAGHWDQGTIWNINIAAVIAGTWYGLYTATDSNVGANLQFNVGLATSTDGLNWTKQGTNPVLMNLSSPTVYNVGGTYYAFGTFADLISGGQLQLPTEMGFARATAADFSTWTVPTNVFQRTTVQEGVGNSLGQTGTNASLVEVNGKTYLYYSTDPDGLTATGYLLQAATANMTLAQVVASKQQVYTPVLQSGLATLASSFTWTPSKIGSTILLIADQSFTFVSDSSGDTWTLDGSQDGGYVSAYHSVTGSLAARTVTFSGTARLVWVEVDATATPVDAFVGHFNSTATSTNGNSGTLTSTKSNDVLFEIGINYVTTGALPAYTSTSGQTIVEAAISSNEPVWVAYRQLAATGSQSETGTVQATAFGIFSMLWAIDTPLPLPAPTSISPTSDEQGFTGNVTVSGTNFSTGTLSFSGTGITVNSYSVQNSTTITANISISITAALTARDVVVTNADAQTGTLAGAFTITSGAPIPISILPTTGMQGATFNITMTGTNFSTGTLSFSGTGITVNSYSVQNSTTITANISVNIAAATTARDVTVTNADTQTGVLVGGFTVLEFGFIISGSLGPAGAGATVTLSGAASASTTADGSGNYSFVGFAPGTYVVTPSKTGVAFAPTMQTVVVTSSDVSVNFGTFLQRRGKAIFITNMGPLFIR